jgi:hypothetical protein
MFEPFSWIALLAFISFGFVIDFVYHIRNDLRAIRRHFDTTSENDSDLKSIGTTLRSINVIVDRWDWERIHRSQEPEMLNSLRDSVVSIEALLKKLTQRMDEIGTEISDISASERRKNGM